jgi:hypothetical protein
MNTEQLEKQDSDEAQEMWPDPTVKEIYQIPEHNMGYLMEQVDKLNKRANKLGLDPIIVERIGHFDKTHRFNDLGFYRREEITIRYVEVQITGKSPKFNGWTFIATIEHEKASKNLIKTIPGIELDHYYRDAPPDCHHCNTNRWRKKTYICRHEDGKEMQVGSTCVKDFLGHKSPESIAWQCEMLGKVREMFFNPDSEEDGYRVPRSAMRIPIRELFQIVAQSVRERGWVSKSKAWEQPEVYGESTYDDVMNMMFPGPNEKCRIDTNTQDAKLAYGARQWAEALHPDKDGKFSDYEYNINVLAQESSIGLSELGLAASIVGVWKMKLDRMKQNKGPKRLNEYFGEVKTRYDLELTVKSISGFDGEWGYTTIYKMRDQENRAFSWFSTSHKVSLDEGETYKCKATVKKHQEWKDWKETVLTRLNLPK